MLGTGIIRIHLDEFETKDFDQPRNILLQQTESEILFLAILFSFDQGRVIALANVKQSLATLRQQVLKPTHRSRNLNLFVFPLYILQFIINIPAILTTGWLSRENFS